MAQSQTRRALMIFAAVAAVCLVAMGTDRYVHRAVEVAVPSYADSLAGVVVRVVPEIAADSTDVGRVRWYVSGDRWLSWTQGDQYDYRGGSMPSAVVTACEAVIAPMTITCATGQLTVEMAKHELAHLLWRTGLHPDSAFARIEAYRGR